ncbi:pirin family protein [Nocardiopsis lambiniae]|uniref:Pirin family protein n=1 Tax=Nocardiopsis lambiniae TaxID=3075539 RepID=A0ABU2MFM5_9ACTN|nr:pirin family protein [Nocardiopsis sp. DSM 44743]MDT0331504.1 pirin family protein [Nocardiopsis sp. DSM 44743]
MSNLETHPVEESVCGGEAAPAAPDPDAELLLPREVPLGGPRAMPVRRALPGKHRRMIGAWCFADVYGPDDVSAGEGMQVPPHPHIGLQTISWLVRGSVHHRDSLGSDRLVRPGRLNLMSAGHGIAHSERTPADAPALLHGAQLWVALPDGARDGAPVFEHHADLPVFEVPGARVTVLVGEVAGHRSAATAHTPLVGAEVLVEPGARVRLPLDADFEHGVLPLDAPVSLLGHRVEAGALLYLGQGRTEVELSVPESAEPAHLLLLGGEPFTEDLVMWWNFVGRDHDEIVAARDAWEAGRTAPGEGRRFGAVIGDDGAALPAPGLPNARLRPRPRHRSDR